ncbi:nitroreductase family protein [Merdimmobilis hominis]|jgi:nitroreductase|uniref:nitroreductase family protein n=1 Tax=Merdimmobilis hominis TaxID=2897707 RepID=UPI0006C811C1|nr:nitroreductase [Merdimmobilis hominis]
MNESMKTLLNRRSVRSFRPEQLREEDLAAILKAGTYAPSAMGKQPAVMVVVQDEATRSQLSQMNAAILGKPGTDPFYGAPTVVVVLSQGGCVVEDGSLVMGNLMNAAAAIGVGSCWIHRAKEEFASPEGKALLQKWGLSEDYIGVGHCILGYPDGPLPEAKPRKADYIVRV